MDLLNFGDAVPDGTPLKALAAHVLNRIAESGDPWLIVYDNAEELFTLFPTLATEPPTHTLITKAYGQTARDFAPKHLV